MIGVLVAAMNVRVWKIAVANLINHAVEKSTAEEKINQPSFLFLIIGKLLLLGILFGVVFREAPQVVVPTLLGFTSYVLLGTLLILFISYNKG